MLLEIDKGMPGRGATPQKLAHSAGPAEAGSLESSEQRHGLRTGCAGHARTFRARDRSGGPGLMRSGGSRSRHRLKADRSTTTQDDVVRRLVGPHGSQLIARWTPMQTGQGWVEATPYNFEGPVGYVPGCPLAPWTRMSQPTRQCQNFFKNL